MAFQDTLKAIERSGIVAIARLSDLSGSVPFSRALIEGGITALEITFTNPEAPKAIAEVKKALPEFRNGTAVIGAGTVLTVAQAEQAAEHGAEFIVTPVVGTDVIEFCVKNKLPVMPGAFTPTEIVKAWDAGATAVKVFPVRALGPDYIKDVLGPLPSLRLMPTGGVDLENIEAYFKAGAYALGVGGNLIDKKLIAAKDWNGLKAKAQLYSDAVKRARSS